MVNFKARLGGKTAVRPVDPIELYKSLDRAHDKGPLRPSQEAVLQQWNARPAKVRDIISQAAHGPGEDRLIREKSTRRFLSPQVDK